MVVDKKLLIQLRQQTGAGIADCQRALKEAKGDFDQAIEVLRKKGTVKAAKKLAEREAQEGLVESYIHANGKVGVLIRVSCETDFVAKNKEFKELAHDLAMQVAASNPFYLSPKDVPEEVIDKEKEIYQEQLKKEGKPKKVWDKIVEGKLQKYFEEVCLLKQSFIKNDKITVEELIQQKIAKLGEKIEVKEFIRYQI